MFPFPVVIHHENEQVQPALLRPFIVVGVGDGLERFQSYDLSQRGRRVCRHREHSTIMIYPLFLTCSRKGG